MELIDKGDLKEMLCLKDLIQMNASVDSRIVDKMIDSAPTVEAEPVRHGHWIELWTGYKCSECARVLIIAPIAPFGNYCPYCGAKMDGDEE